MFHPGISAMNLKVRDRLCTYEVWSCETFTPFEGVKVK